MKNNKGFANIWLVVLVVAVVVVGGYFFLQKLDTPPTQEPPDQTSTPATDETAGWEVYKDEKFQIELKQPLKTNTSTFHFVVSAFNTDLDIDKAVVSENEIGYAVHKVYGYGTKNPEITKLIVDGQEARLIKHANGKLFGLITSYPKPLTIKETGSDSYKFAHIRIFEPDINIVKKFIQTIKFMDGVKTDETTSWQTYRNEKYKFEFKYPNDWKDKSTNLDIFKQGRAVSVNGKKVSELLSATYLSGNGFETSVYVSNDINCKNESTWVAQEILSPVNVVSARENIKAANLDASKISYFYCGSSANPTCFAYISVCIHSSPSIVFDFTDGREVNGGKPTTDNISQSNRILSTFKFTK